MKGKRSMLIEVNTMICGGYAVGLAFDDIMHMLILCIMRIIHCDNFGQAFGYLILNICDCFMIFLSKF